MSSAYPYYAPPVPESQRQLYLKCLIRTQTQDRYISYGFFFSMQGQGIDKQYSRVQPVR